MTPAEIIAELRRQAGLRNATWPCILLFELMPLCDEVERLESEIKSSRKAVEDEREACAKKCDELQKNSERHYRTYEGKPYDPAHCAVVIRARGNKGEAG
jgi:hypothetical protein